MESVFANDTTEDLLEMLESTRKQCDDFKKKAKFCRDCMLNIVAELNDRGYQFN